MIAVAGEALIDLVPGEPGALSALTPSRGGGPYNTAVALGRLGAAPAFLSRISTDAFGQSLMAGLREAGVDVSPVQRGPEPTTLALASVGEEGSARYTFYVEGTADRLFRRPERLPEGLRALCFGTCSLALEPGASAYEQVLRRASARGLFTMLDPNIRQGLIPDPGAYRARFRSWLADTTLLKLSEEDAEWLGGTPEEWLAAGPEAVVVTRGAGGLDVLGRWGRCEVPAVPVRVVDTIGAGDTVNAALLHRLSAQGVLAPGSLGELGAERWRDVLGYAARAAALTCSRAGAQPPTAREMETGEEPEYGPSPADPA
ncbi:carbohydrate kinase family protein [Streptomyces physcomitrii]|uniref:Carbohydrate kinase n=1 Tax=Streptomyces physcomitrii TaxID=2724184 RepID=A0ABX1H202_9ACTN|nr:carbohydrate kinase [Streptomyces physcomitrii]NKI41269.1 carbohydrate kinase [Streptomyces physcomitrii]